MDPITALLAGYLTTSAESIGNQIANSAVARMDTEVKVETVEYQGIDVDFSHQMWRIQDSSVCGQYRGDVVKRSACTHAAKDLFAESCKRLSDNRSAHPDYSSLKAMYCSAAARFRPTQAGIEWTDPGAISPDAEALQECRLAQAALLTENTPENRYRKKRACAKVRSD
ncbi:hypothetical protein [Imhoffiella purpurea]|uniref:Uncharacterized protein n=1 Tax=Imhoffiella purpurea TaxID=1249627 RepID=W9VV51_9GAMM|nr:hypothetical protein [Imhoffiella purpurea]EXJ14280.1 hypothetical protein D779_2818 [Imhoffiella purpurea]